MIALSSVRKGLEVGQLLGGGSMVASAGAGGISLPCTFAGEFAVLRIWTMVPTAACCM